MAHSPHRRWKGCAMCKAHKHRGNGDAARTPHSALKRIGRKCRWGRHDIEGDE